MNRVLKIVLVLIVWLASVGQASAQLWSSVMDSTRGIDWQGAVYNPPNTSQWATCATLTPSASGDDTAQINNAVASCGPNSIIVLSAGTFTVPATINILGKNNIVLRGQGADKTIVRGGINSLGGCQNSKLYFVCIASADGGANYYGGTGAATNGVSGFNQGSQSITVADASGISTGQNIFVNQLDEDNSLIYAEFPYCHGTTGDALWENGQCESGIDHRPIVQIVRVTGKSGNTLTIDRPLYYHRWSNSLSPQVYYFPSTNAAFVQNVGIENLRLDKTWPDGSNSDGVLKFAHCYGCWASGITINQCDGGCLNIGESQKVSVLHSYFYKNVNAANTLSSTYGVQMGIVSDVTISNNIAQQLQAPFIVNGGPGTGIVWSYNFTTDNTTPISGGNVMSWSGFWPTHSPAAYVLIEGNKSTGVNWDLSHGVGCCVSIVRNYFDGSEPNQGQTAPQFAFTMSIPAWTGRFGNVVGNVLGKVGFHNNYESSLGPQGVTGLFDTSIYALGWNCTGQRETCDYTVPTGTLGGYDQTAVSSLLRWGNYDTVTGNVRWCGNADNTGFASRCGSHVEIPQDQKVPISESVPNSFFLASKPSWFGSVPWPPIGPDVAGNFGPGNHANKIPAQLCYESLGGTADGTGTLLNFNATTCYGTASTITLAPAKPSGLALK